ncbi:hypothetical protein ABMA28_005041 [Loxostege sticticalis]|uniref:Uncharacterized protein n=1 Tax=Loxostege sticticalis TaxID=481309 RepID=A0ABD0SP21_LOXSC
MMQILVPLCKYFSGTDFIFTHYDLKTVLEYRDLLVKGGYFESPLCRARHRIAVIVPYRGRDRNLAVFLYVMHPFLIEQGLEYRIFVIEQSGNELFNRGRLLNVGFVEAQKHGKWGCMVFHDVDLLPTTDKIKYTCPTWPRHMCGSVLGRPETDKYKSHFGGVTAMTPSHYEKVNGYSNWYWGWGGEDTDMFWRIKNSGLALTRYSKSVAVYKALPHKQEPENPIRKKLLKNTQNGYKTDGLSNCRYTIISKTMYHTYTHILVDINPDKENVTEFQLQWQ